MVTLLIISILTTLNTGDITYNDITYNWFYLETTLLITVNKKDKHNLAVKKVFKKCKKALKVKSQVIILPAVLRTHICSQCYKTFYGRNLLIFVIS